MNLVRFEVETTQQVHIGRNFHGISQVTAWNQQLVMGCSMIVRRNGTPFSSIIIDESYMFLCSYMFKMKDIIKAAWIFQPCNMLQESNMKYHTVD